MEIKLSDEDIERLADALQSRIEKKLHTNVAYQAAYDALAERAKEFINSSILSNRNFTADAAEILRKELLKEGHTPLKAIVNEAVVRNMEDPKGLGNVVRKAIFQHAMYAAREAAEQLNY